MSFPHQDAAAPNKAVISQTDFISQADKIQQFIEGIVDSGDDQELFISAWVNGHFDLAVAKCLSSDSATIATLDQHMQNSLTAAQEELASSDFKQALQFWQLCFQQVA